MKKFHQKKQILHGKSSSKSHPLNIVPHDGGKIDDCLKKFRDFLMVNLNFQP